MKSRLLFSVAFYLFIFVLFHFAAPPEAAAQLMTSSGGTSSQPLALKTLNVSGFINNTSGVFLDSEALNYNKSKNSLATERNFVQLDVNDDPTENDQVFMRFWGVYEPSYPWETNCLNPRGVQTHCNSDFYNQYGLREFWIKHRIGPLQLFIGKQIVKWGESVTFRATDQINPQDLSWSFGFANIEQTYMPVWMIHPILNLPDFGPFGTNFLEVVYEPGFDFMYTNVNYSDDHLFGMDPIAGRETLLGGLPGGRFTGRPDNRGCTSPTGGPKGTVCTGEGPPPAGAPIAQAPPFVMYQVGGPAGTGLYVPSPYNPRWVYPSATFANSNVFVRFHTLAYDVEMTAIYANAHSYLPVDKLGSVDFAEAPGVFARNQYITYQSYQGAGFTANRPIYLPGALASLPFVARTEVMYQNHMPFNTFAIPGTVFTHFNPNYQNGSPDGLTYSDVMLWIAGLDLDSAYVPWLTSTGNLTVNAEIDGQTLLSPSRKMQQFLTYFNPMYHNDISGSLNITSSWWWGAIAPTWTMAYDPNGETFAFFPSLTLTPPWTNKYFATFRWIEVLGTNRYGFPNGGLDIGILKGLSMLTAQFQYNFDLI